MHRFGIEHENRAVAIDLLGCLADAPWRLAVEHVLQVFETCGLVAGLDRFRGLGVSAAAVSHELFVHISTGFHRAIFGKISNNRKFRFAFDSLRPFFLQVLALRFRAGCIRIDQT